MSDSSNGQFDSPAPRFASRGKAYVYVLPCRDRDLVKLGFARDPLQRFISLHRRFHVFFDLTRGLLVEVDKVAEARKIERILLRQFVAERGGAPLEVREAAGGKTEWYRGVDARVMERARELALEGGHATIAPLRRWFTQRLTEDADRVYDWSARVYEVIREAEHYGADASKAVDVLSLTLERYEAAGLAIASLVPDDVMSWFQQHAAQRF